MLAEPAEGWIELRPGTVIDGDAAPGEIVISTDGDGSVRRVAADGSLEPATLFDAFASARFTKTFTVDGIELDERVTAKLDVDVGAVVTLAPTIEIAFELDDRGLVSLDANMRGTLDTELDSLLELQRGGGWDGVKTIASKPRRLRSEIDGVPIILVTRVVTDVAVYGGGPVAARLGANAIAHVDLDAQAHYDRFAGWTALDSSSRNVVVRTFGALAANGARTHVDAVITQRLEVALFDRPLAYIELRATSSAEAADCLALGEGSIGAGIGVNGSALYPDVLLRDTPLFRQVHPNLSETQCQ